MILADVNVLIYAFRSDLPQHAVCKPWLDKLVRGDAQFGVSPLALSAVARITTNPPQRSSELTRVCSFELTR